MYAFRQTVEKRSYSRYWGSTSDETDRNASGNSSRTISATRASCCGFRNENRKQTATDSTPASFSFADLLARLRLVERDEHRAVAGDPLGHRQPVAAAHDRVALPRQILVVREVERLLVPRDVEDVAVALGRDQPDLGAVVLDHDVGRDRRAVEDLVQLRQATMPRVRSQLADPCDRSLRGVLGRGRHLVDEDLARLVVHVDQVGERAADIDSESLHRAPLRSRA